MSSSNELDRAPSGVYSIIKFVHKNKLSTNYDNINTKKNK